MRKPHYAVLKVSIIIKEQNCKLWWLSAIFLLSPLLQDVTMVICHWSKIVAQGMRYSVKPFNLKGPITKAKGRKFCFIFSIKCSPLPLKKCLSYFTITIIIVSVCLWHWSDRHAVLFRNNYYPQRLDFALLNRLPSYSIDFTPCWA